MYRMWIYYTISLSCFDSHITYNFFSSELSAIPRQSSNTDNDEHGKIVMLC